jgi:hypothetical protein
VGIVDSLKKHEWQHVLRQIQKNPNHENKILEAFDKVIGLHHAICLRDG